MAAADIASIPTKLLGDLKLGQGKMECAICMVDVAADDYHVNIGIMKHVWIRC